MTIETTAEAAPAKKDPHPVLFLVLFSPFGIATGYASTTLGFQLGHNGVPAAWWPPWWRRPWGRRW
jgi:hypothetical protein